MNNRYLMEFVLSHWWLLDKVCCRNNPDTFTDNPYPGHHVVSTNASGRVRTWVDGEEQYIEEWSTI